MFIMLVKYFGGRAVADLLPRIEKPKRGRRSGVPVTDLPAKCRHSPVAWSRYDSVSSAQSKAFFKPSTVPGKAKFSFAEFPDQVEIPINPNILYRRKLTMGSYSSSYRLQSLAADIVFNRRIDVEALISDRYPLQDLSAAVERAIIPVPVLIRFSFIRSRQSGIQQGSLFDGDGDESQLPDHPYRAC